MTITGAILQVMNDAGHPITPAEAYRRIVERGLYSFRAQNPLSVVTGQIRRHCQGLDFPTAEATKYFRLESDGTFSPLSSPIRATVRGERGRRESRPALQPERRPLTLKTALAEIRSLQRKYKELLKERVLKDLKGLSPEGFEHFATKLLDVYGFEGMRVTRKSKDGGIDGHGRLKVGLAHMRVAFQCKRWIGTSVGRGEIDQFRGAIQGGFEQGLFLTTAHFASTAKAASIKPGAVPIVLLDGPSIVELMFEKALGVQEELLSVHTYALDTILAQDPEDDEKAGEATAKMREDPVRRRRSPHPSE